MKKPPQPVHIAGTARGEEMALKKNEAGRGTESSNKKSYRSARDSTGICAEDREPIVSVMGYLPPA